MALPALVALGASLTGFDAAIKALKIPSYLSTIRTSLTSISDTFSKMNTRALELVDKIKAIKLPKFPDIDIPRLQVTLPESWTKFGTRISTAIGDALPKVDDIKLPKIPLPDFETFRTSIAAKITSVLPDVSTLEDIKVRFPKMPEFELPKIPTIQVPEKITTFFDRIRAFNTSLLDFKIPEQVSIPRCRWQAI